MNTDLFASQDDDTDKADALVDHLVDVHLALPLVNPITPDLSVDQHAAVGRQLGNFLKACSSTFVMEIDARLD